MNARTDDLHPSSDRALVLLMGMMGLCFDQGTAGWHITIASPMQNMITPIHALASCLRSFYSEICIPAQFSDMHMIAIQHLLGELLFYSYTYIEKITAACHKTFFSFIIGIIIVNMVGHYMCMCAQLMCIGF